MPNKPIKAGFKVWCCCYSYCGYLKLRPSYWKITSEKEMVARVVKDLVGPLSGLNHVVYMDNYFTNKYMDGVDRLSQVKKPIVLIENRSDTGYVLFFSFFYCAINNAYLLYKHNCKLFDMPPKELLDFRADIVKLQIRKSMYRKRPVASQSSSHSRDGVPSVVPSVERKVSPLLGCRQTSSSSHHLCLLVL